MPGTHPLGGCPSCGRVPRPRALAAAYPMYALTHLRWVPRPGYSSDQDGDAVPLGRGSPVPLAFACKPNLVLRSTRNTDTSGRKTRRT